jgi:hypothetical protein
MVNKTVQFSSEIVLFFLDEMYVIQCVKEHNILPSLILLRTSITYTLLECLTGIILKYSPVTQPIYPAVFYC